MGVERNLPGPLWIVWRVTPKRAFALSWCLPQIGADHHGVLQSFASVHGDNGHRAFRQVAVGLPDVRGGFDGL